jgi:CRISPR-associated endonuclease Csn1
MDLPSGEKNRLDHRHHAVDAIVIALTNQPRLQQLARVRRFTGVQQAPAADDFLPWPAFRDAAIESLRAICVSHRVRRKVAGALHEESIYGPTATEGELVIRKPVGSLTCNMVHEIRDPVVREKVVERLRQLGIEPGRGKDSKIPAEVWREPLWMNETLRIPITKVRLIRREKTVQPIRGGTAFVKPGNTHHLCLFEISEVAGRTRREAVFVSMIEAKRRIRAREPLIQKSHPSIPNARFLMSLSGNEMLLLDHGGQMEVYRYDTAASTSGQMWFKHHAAGGKGAERIGRVSKMPSTFSGQKITVDPIGRIRRAGD